jgi:ABC-type transporter Mla subunit MlaD
MRRRFAAVALAAGMLAAAACGNNDDGDGGQSTEEVCNRLNEQLAPLDAELNSALSEAGAAAAQGDDAALAEAVVELDATVSQITDVVRDGAADAEDEEFSTALETFATELENLASGAASGEVPDMTAFEAARSDVEQYCGE